MLEVLNHLFGALCGQNADHTWAPGGVLVPCCQRCTGLYVGACVAALSHLFLKPRLTGRFLGLHALFLSLVAPFCFHWLPQGPILRTVTGSLFGFAVVTFIWLPLASCLNRSSRNNAALTPWASYRGGQINLSAGTSELGSYLIFLAGALVALPGLGAYGGKAGGYLLSAMAFAGAITLAALTVGNLWLFLVDVTSVARRAASKLAHAKLGATERGCPNRSNSAVVRTHDPQTRP
jgi:hypothetical protein